MESTKSYYLYELQEKYTGQDWMPVIPRTYSIDGNGTMPMVLKSDYEEVCDNNDYSKEYLTIESLEDNNVISWMAGGIGGGGITAKTISASTDDGVTWTAYTSSTGNGTTIATLNAGDKLIIKGENTAYGHNSINKFGSTGQFNVYGNIMSMISGDSFDGATTLTEGMTFQGLFEVCTGLTSAEHLILPATTLVDTCYGNMFQGCTNLTTAPVLPATTLARYCYIWMFENCTSLTKAPELPATTLRNHCYYRMFQGCTSLNYVKCLATDISAIYCTDGWVYSVASSGTFVKASSMGDWTRGFSGIPTGWTVQNA